MNKSTLAAQFQNGDIHDKYKLFYALMDDYAALETAAKPFAHPDLCKRLPNNGTNENAPIFVRNNAVITLADCRRIAELLDPER